MKDNMFAGKTPTGAKVHRCWNSNSALCNDSRSRWNHFYPVKGSVHRKDLCKKCFSSSVSVESLQELGLELKGETVGLPQDLAVRTSSPDAAV